MTNIEKKTKRKELWEVWSFRISSAAIMIFFSICLVGVTEVFLEEFPFPKLYLNPIHYLVYLYFLLPVILCGTIFCLYRKPRHDVKKKKRRKITANILMVITVLSVLNVFTLAIGVYMPPMYTETDDSGHYLQLGSCEQAEASIYTLFPAEIPGSAEDVQYYYLHEHVIDPVHEVYAQWVLPEAEFHAEVQQRQNSKPIHQETLGEWTCLHFTTYTMEDAASNHYNFRIFAYHPKTHTVRYISSYAMDTGDGRTPYFFTLEW